MTDTDKISETAFLVSVSRRNLPEVSGDKFATLWITEEAEALHKSYCEIVSPPTDMVVSIRGRYFLEKMRHFLKKNKESVVINLGAGFTNYPFLVDEPCRFVEVDFPHVIDYKKEKVLDWQNQGVLPQKNVTFLSADFCSIESHKDLTVKLTPIAQQCSSFVLLEAVVYYLTSEVLASLFRCLENIQIPGSFVVLNYWPHGQLDTEVFKSQQSFFEERLRRAAKDYLLLDSDFFESIDGYRVISQTNIQDLELLLNGTDTLENSEKALASEFIVMERT